MKNPDLQLLVDTLVIETLLAEPKITKTAEEGGLTTSLVSAVKDYVMSHIDQKNPVSSVLALLTPGILSALGLPVLGFLVWLAKVVFRIDLAAIFSSIGSAIQGKISGGEKTNSSEVESIVTQAVMGNAGSEPTEDDIARIENLKPDQSAAKDHKITLAEAKLFNYALNDFVKKNPNFDLKNPPINVLAANGLFSSKLVTFIGGKNKTLKLLVFVIGWIVKVVLASAGFMIAEDAVNKLLGRTDSTKPDTGSGSETVNTSALPQASTQQVFKVNTNYTTENLNNKYNRWIVQISPDQIDRVVLTWAQDVYPDLKGKDALVRSTQSFQTLINLIKDYNDGNVTGMTFIPKNFRSRKEVVDKFIDEVALKSGSGPFNAPNGKKPSLAV